MIALPVAPPRAAHPLGHLILLTPILVSCGMVEPSSGSLLNGRTRFRCYSEGYESR